MFDQETMKQIVSASLTAALGEDTMTRIVQEFLNEIVNRKVNSKGGDKDDWSDKANIPYLDWLVKGELQKITTEAVLEYMQERAPDLRQQVRKALADDGNFADRIVDTYLDRLTQSDVRLRVDFEVRPNIDHADD